MNRTSRHIIAVFGAVVTLVSCTKEAVVEPEGSGLLPQGQMREIAVSFEESTRTVLGTYIGTTYHKYRPAFCAGDKIKVSNATRSEDCTVTADGSVLKIFTNLEGELTAVYPASAANVTGTGPVAATPYKISSTQSGKFSDANICTATIAANSTTASFFNRTALLRFYVDESIGVQKITITSATNDIATDGTNKKVITVDPDGTALISSVTEEPDKRICYVAISPGNHTLTFESVTTGQGQGTVSNTMRADFAYTQNKIYNAFIPYYIDLGAVGKWAYCNLGAFLPEEAGKYFAWGDTVGYRWTDTKFEDNHIFSQANAPFWNGSAYTKYATEGQVLELEDDAAHVQWGADWRIPTGLVDGELTVMWKSGYMAYDTGTPRGYYYFVPGDIGKSAVRGPITDVPAEKRSLAKLFFPAVGATTDAGTGVGDSGICHYWSSTSFGPNASYIKANASSSTPYNIPDSFYKFKGRSIRPIYDPVTVSDFGPYTDEGDI